jgi:hypothetical protein
MNSTLALLGWGNQELMILLLLVAAIVVLPRLLYGKTFVIHVGERFLIGVLGSLLVLMILIVQK